MEQPSSQLGHAEEVPYLYRLPQKLLMEPDFTGGARTDFTGGTTIVKSPCIVKKEDQYKTLILYEYIIYIYCS